MNIYDLLKQPKRRKPSRDETLVVGFADQASNAEKPNHSLLPIPAANGESILEQLQREFASTFPEDDPIRYYVRGYELALERGARQNVQVLKDGLKSTIVEGREEMKKDALATLKNLNEEMMMYSRNALSAINSGRNQANQYIVSALVEMKALANEMQESHHLSKWTERIIGAVIALMFLLVGILIGRAK